jgi:membrane-bound serine protease (ClpP class)
LKPDGPFLLALTALILLLPFLSFLPAGSQPAVAPKVLLVEVSGHISTSTAEWLEDVLLRRSFGYSAVLITINTFGGLADATLRIMDAIMSSPVPVIVYVYPPGGQALSAGTYILMSADLAAMAPYTIIGSAQPVVGGVPTEEPKVVNFLVEKMRTMARLHGRNETQAARFVTHNDNLGPELALKRGVIEVIAENVEDLLEKADGRAVKRMGGEVVLRLKGAVIEKASADLRIAVLDALSDPLLSTLLLSLGFLILIVGLSNPGLGAELTGAILILLGLIGQGFNVNWVGLGLIILGSVLILYEFYTGGTLIALPFGIAMIVLGSVLIVRAPPGNILIASSWLDEAMLGIAAAGVFAGSVVGFIIFKALRAAKRRPVPMVPSTTGRAVEDIPKGSEGYAVIGGEYRRVMAVKDVKQGQRLRVVGKQDNVFLVEPVEQ